MGSLYLSSPVSFFQIEHTSLQNIFVAVHAIQRLVWATTDSDCTSCIPPTWLCRWSSGLTSHAPLANASLCKVTKIVRWQCRKITIPRAVQNNLNSKNRTRTACSMRLEAYACTAVFLASLVLHYRISRRRFWSTVVHPRQIHGKWLAWKVGCRVLVWLAWSCCSNFAMDGSNAC